MKSTMMQSPLLISSMLDRAGKLFPGVEIVSSRPDGSRHRCTNADLHRRSHQLAASLQRAGLAKGDRVATLMWNCSEHLEAYFGIPESGGVVHTLSLRQHPDELAYIMNHAADRFLIVEDVLLDVFERIRSRVRCERVLVVDRGSGRLPEGTEAYEAFIEGPGDPSDPGLTEDDACAMCYTSGTTGRPKGVLYSHRAIALHSLAISLPDLMGISRFDTALPIVPMFHANAWGVPFAATMVGSKQVMPGRNLQPEALLDLIQDEQVTVIAGVPTIWLGALNALEREPGRWKLTDGLRVLVGGAAAPESMIRRFDKLGVRLIHGWGMTETTPVATSSTLKPEMASWSEDERYAVRARQGLPLPFIETRVIAEQGEAPWDGETTGELEVRGPWVAASYYDAAQPDKWTADGWFRTGDMVTIDSGGYVKITDRVKDLIKSGGEWISSVDLENTLMGHEAVREAAVIAVPHPKWQERPLAVVILKEGRTVETTELRAFLAQTFASWQLPDAFVFVNQLPYTATGKVLKRKLREDFADWQWENAGRAELASQPVL
ncbi:MAG: long-chain fatty acid--CoA ligase [Terracidiphilus sp.]